MSSLLPEMNPITFTISYQGQELPVRTYQNQYFSLMALILDKVEVQGFGMCSGMGSCGTCMLTICHNRSTYEKTTLSCQVGVNDDLANVKIVIPDKVY